MKKLIPLFALCVLAIGITGCGSDSSSSSDSKPAAPTTTDEDSDKVTVPRLK